MDTSDKVNTSLDKSFSDPEINRVGLQPKGTPPNFVSVRNKRPREDDYSNEFSRLREEMHNMFQDMMKTQAQEFARSAAALQVIQSSNNNIESSIAFLMAQHEEYQKRIITLEEKAKEDKKYIAILEERLEIIQQDSRKTNIEIKNVPKKNNETKEDLVEMVLKLSDSVGCKMERPVIRDIYRIKAKKNSTENTPVIVELNSTLVKNDVLRSCKSYNIKQKTKLCARHLGMRTQEDTPIFVSEQLTPRAARLHFLARDLVKSKIYKYCWTAYGRVYLRKYDNTPVINIKSEAQIQQLITDK